MNIHEYQAKQIFAKYGVPTPRGIMVECVKLQSKLLKS